MRIARNQNLESALSRAEHVRKLMCEVGKNALAEEMAGFIKVAKEQRFVIGLVGSAKRGKSTMINGLLGRLNDACAPIGKFPATNMVSIFGYSENPSAKVIFADNTDREITESEIRLYVTEEHNPGNGKNVRSVEVLGPFAGLEKGVYLVDTPGANNALSAMHGEILLEFLPVADAVIFLVTADEPLTEAEQKLLRAIKGNNTKKLFFAVNKVDRVDSGDLDRDELAQGIEHNRKILADVGFPGAAIYEVSAKNYFEKQYDPGTERLLAAVREMIAKERLTVMVERLEDRTKAVFEQCHVELSSALRESKLTIQELEAERKALEATRKGLQRGKSARERQFTDDWNAAFDELDKKLRAVRKELIGEYSTLINNTSPMRVPALAQTIHADVQVSFAERLRLEMEKCEAKLNTATADLGKSIHDEVMLTLSPEITPGATGQSNFGDSLKVGFSTVPALVTGTVSAALPGIVANLIMTTLPPVVTMTGNPLTWGAGLASLFGKTVVVGVSTSVTTALSVIAMPIAIGAFGVAAFRGYSTWREIKNMQKNELKSKVTEMVDDGCGQVALQISQYRKLQSKILAEFDRAIEASIEQADNRLAELLANRPSPRQIQMLEDNVAVLNKKQTLLLAMPEMEGEGSGSSPLVDDLRTIK